MFPGLGWNPSLVRAVLRSSGAGRAWLVSRLVCLSLTSSVTQDGPLNLPEASFPYLCATDLLCASTKLPTQCNWRKAVGVFNPVLRRESS